MIEDNIITFNQILEEFGLSPVTAGVAIDLGVSEDLTFDELHLIAVDYLVELEF